VKHADRSEDVTADDAAPGARAGILLAAVIRPVVILWP